MIMLVIFLVLSRMIGNQFFPAPTPTGVIIIPTSTLIPGIGAVASPTGLPLPSDTATAPAIPGTPAKPTNSPSVAETPVTRMTSTLNPQALPDLNGNKGLNWTMVFGDDFNNGHIDLNKWVPCYWWDNQGCTNAGNNELEWYLPNNIIFNPDSIVLVAKPQNLRATDGKTYPYSSGMITTGRDSNNPAAPVKFSYQYGYSEIHARVPKGKGIWPAFWMLPANNDALPEIDVMEIIGDDPQTVNMTLHYQQSKGSVIKEGYAWTGNADLSLDWHTYGVDWEPDFIAWYVDGVVRWRYTNKAHIPAEPMYLLLNLAVGGDWPGNPDQTTTFPSEFQIDYLRVWQQVNQLP
jgi:beta-glucanase (GH16 family)